MRVTSMLVANVALATALVVLLRPPPSPSPTRRPFVVSLSVQATHRSLTTRLSTRQAHLSHRQPTLRQKG